MSSRGGVGRTACGRAGWPSPHLGLAGAIFLILSSSAQAAHCRHGEIWLIHKHSCIGKTRSVHAAVPEMSVHFHALPPNKPVKTPEPQSTRTPDNASASVTSATPRPQPLAIPYVLPSSIMGHVQVFDFEALPKPATATNPNRSE
jgi:hypothetical protein